MSQEAQDTLWTATSNALGAEVTGGTDAGWVELAEIGYIGPNRGLTRKGSIARERMVNVAQDKAFGA